MHEQWILGGSRWTDRCLGYSSLRQSRVSRPASAVLHIKCVSSLNGPCYLIVLREVKHDDVVTRRFATITMAVGSVNASGHSSQLAARH